MTEYFVGVEGARDREERPAGIGARMNEEDEQCKERQRWTDEDENPPLADLAHIYGGTCEGMKESSGRAVMDTVAHQSQQAITVIEKATKNADRPQCACCDGHALWLLARGTERSQSRTLRR